MFSNFAHLYGFWPLIEREGGWVCMSLFRTGPSYAWPKTLHNCCIYHTKKFISYDECFSWQFLSLPCSPYIMHCICLFSLLYKFTTVIILVEKFAGIIRSIISKLEQSLVKIYDCRLQQNNNFTYICVENNHSISHNLICSREIFQVLICFFIFNCSLETCF